MSVTERRVYHHVRTEVRDGVVVQVKFCRSCGQDKIVSEGPESGFSISARVERQNPTYRADCKDCAREIHQARMASDPEYAARVRERSRRGQRRYLAKPDKREIARAASRTWHRKKRSTEAGRLYLNESSRLAYALRREREGKTPRYRSTVIDGTLPRIEAAPFRAWLMACLAQVPGINSGEALAAELDICVKRVRDVLSGRYRKVALDVVSRALTNAYWTVEVDNKVIVTLDDLYPEGW